MGTRRRSRSRDVPVWSPAEIQILRSHLDTVLRGEYGEAKVAAQDCKRELQQLYRKHPDGPWASVVRSPQGLHRKLRALALQAGHLVVHSRWTPAELRVVERYAKTLARDHSLPFGQAVARCTRELDRLRRAKPAEYAPRPPTAVRLKLRVRVRPSLRIRWSPAELRVVRRHGRALAQGRYRNTEEAAAKCRQELRSLSSRYPTRYRARSLVAIASRVRHLARNLDWVGARHRLGPHENSLLDRFADSFAKGDYRTVKEAALACRAELKGLYRRGLGHRPRALATVHDWLSERLRKRGLTSGMVKWTPAEERLVVRYAKALIAGQYRNAKTAARALLIRLWQDLDPADGTLPKGRNASVLAEKIMGYVHRIGVPSKSARWQPEEMRILDSYARAVVEGRYASVSGAVWPCIDALRQHNRQFLETSRELRAVGGRTRAAIQRRLFLRVHRLGWGPQQSAHRRWSEAELRGLQTWLSWYRARHTPGSPGPLTEAAEGLHRELASQGSNRSLWVCTRELTYHDRLQQAEESRSPARNAVIPKERSD